MLIRKLIDVPAEDSLLDKARKSGQEYDKLVEKAKRKSKT